jgi:multidrug efflux pump subunit AcrA (membrane-fusion protein)
MTALKAVPIVLALALGACSHETAEEVESETVVPVTTVAAATGTIRAAINVTGTVTAAPGADQLVVAPQPARIAEITKAEGDLVKAGDLLVRFEIPTLTADVATRRGELARAKARLDNARAAQTRARDLFDRGIVARKEVEEADRELADAQAGITEAEATLAASDTAASQSAVHARFNGVVAKRMHNAGEVVEATASDPVMRVVDPRRLEVTCCRWRAGPHGQSGGRQRHRTQSRLAACGRRPGNCRRSSPSGLCSPLHTAHRRAGAGDHQRRRTSRCRAGAGTGRRPRGE